MDSRRAARNFFKYTLLDQVFEFVYWIAALAGLVRLGSGSGTLSANLPLFVVVCIGYCAAVFAIYFWIVRRLKAFFRS